MPGDSLSIKKDDFSNEGRADRPGATYKKNHTNQATPGPRTTSIIDTKDAKHRNKCRVGANEAA